MLPSWARKTNSGLVLKLKGSKQSHIKVHLKGIIAKVHVKGSNIKGSNIKGSNIKGSNIKGSNIKGSNIKGRRQLGQNGFTEIDEKDVIEAIRIFLAFASYIGFIVYQMDVKSAFLYGTTDEEVYVSQPPGFVDPKFPKKVYKVLKALYDLHQAPKAWFMWIILFLVYKESGLMNLRIDEEYNSDCSYGDALTVFLDYKSNKKKMVFLISKLQRPPILNVCEGSLGIHNWRCQLHAGDIFYMAVQEHDNRCYSTIEQSKFAVLLTVVGKYYGFKIRCMEKSASTIGSLDLMKVLDRLKPFLRWTMFDANAEDDIWKNQEEWILRSWNFYENCGVHTLILEDGTEIHMLAERKYPLTKETLERMLSLELIAESTGESAYNLLRLIQRQIDEYGSYDGREKDL
ncbi:xylulose kinase-1 [Tanacetum coccineum]